MQKRTTAKPARVRPDAPVSVKHKFYQLAVSKAHESTVAAVSASARAALEAHTAANVRRREKQPRTQTPLGMLEKSFQKSTAGKADDACAALFFVEHSIGRVPRASTTQPTSLYDLLTEAMDPGFTFATAFDLGSRRYARIMSHLYDRLQF